MTMLAFITLLLALHLHAATAEFDPDRVSLVDTDGANLFFRGPVPIINGSFALSALKNRLAEVAANSSIELPLHYSLVDISFLDTIKPSEAADLKAEQAFWASQQPSAGGQAGRLIHWPIIGSPINPDSYPKAVMVPMAKHFDTLGLDKVPDKMAAARALLEQQPNSSNPLPTVIYWHCEAGVDRTGEMSGCYAMMHKNRTYNQAFAFNTAVEGREMAKPSIHGMEWCCEWLRYGLGVERGCPYTP